MAWFSLLYYNREMQRMAFEAKAPIGMEENNVVFYKIDVDFFFLRLKIIALATKTKMGIILTIANRTTYINLSKLTIVFAKQNRPNLNKISGWKNLLLHA